MNNKPEVVSGLFGVFLRAVETTVRQCSPGAPAGARFGAVAFVHRFGSYLNSHIHFHVLVTDGVFSAGQDGQAEFHPALDLDDDDFLAVQMKMRKRGLRWLHRHGLERLVRYCARPPLSQERLGRLDDETLVYSLRKPMIDGRTELMELLHNPAKAMTHSAGTS
jgi:hypothetical protein